MEKTNENILGKLSEFYEQLPQNVQEAISSVAIAEKIQEIAKRSGLHIDEAGIVSDEAAMVMLGIENPKDFVDGLKNKLKLPQEKIVTLVKDVDKEIFEPIRESLMKIYQEQETADEELELEMIKKEVTPLVQEKRESISPTIEKKEISTVPVGMEQIETPVEITAPIVLKTEQEKIEKKMSPEELGQKLMEENTIFQNKVGNIVNLPRQETIIKDNQTTSIENKIKHIDPYREPTE